MARYLEEKTGSYTTNSNVLIAHDQGMTVSVFSRCERVMSDVYEYLTYAVSYVPSEDTFKEGYVHGEYGSKAFAFVDATPEVVARYATWLVEQAAKREAAAREASKERALRELSEISRGREVKVVKGRKVPVGTAGQVFWYGQTQYGWRVGFTTAAGEKHFTAASNVEVVVPGAEVARVEERYAA